MKLDLKIEEYEQKQAQIDQFTTFFEDFAKKAEDDTSLQIEFIKQVISILKILFHFEKIFF